MLSIFRGIASKIAPSVSVLSNSQFHTSAMLQKEKGDNDGPTHFLSYNDKMYPPQRPDEEPRPAFICHQKANIKYSPEKMWYIACLIRGMTIDEAVRQLRFVAKKGAVSILETLLEAQEKAVKEHNVEFKSNLWVAESFCGKGYVLKGIRRHAKRRIGRVEYKYCHYFVRLEEGKPPKDYYRNQVTPEQKLEKWLEDKRKRKIYNSL
ncbi:39S ribosomal protein L22, mitochondrial [Sitodiplosis mosellana]|uniref:39S ribosomal protein L22, mitochondrial n=1 Tax=Sitodiplosis mosellana TaxID=263140 RepID=UPI002443D3C4|nr:39S ribosomal protein L22, mitochondrial [Sitodiplosis mosellana]